MISLTIVILLMAMIVASAYLIYRLNKEEFVKSMRRVGAHPHHRRQNKGSR